MSKGYADLVNRWAASATGTRRVHGRRVAEGEELVPARDDMTTAEVREMYQDQVARLETLLDLLIGETVGWAKRAGATKEMQADLKINYREAVAEIRVRAWRAEGINIPEGEQTQINSNDHFADLKRFVETTRASEPQSLKKE